jgi:hypothetical protein
MTPDPIIRIEMALTEAASHVAEEYIRLPIAGGPAIYRERLYCYELYHQLRCTLGDHFEYSIGGEIDKSGHPQMRGRGVTGTKPDLLVHGPGYMERNLLVIEVKPATCRRPKKITKDLQTLTGYRGPGEYKHAWYLIYGGSKLHVKRFRLICKGATREQADPPIDLRGIQLFWHPGPTRGIIPIPWLPA